MSRLFCTAVVVLSYFHCISSATTNRPSSTTYGSTSTQSNDVTTTETSVISTTQTSTQLPVTTTTAPPACPRYATRYSDNDLIIPYQDGKCEIVVKAEMVTLRFPGLEELFGTPIRKQQKKLYRPSVAIRRLESTTDAGEPEAACEELGMRKIGPFVFIDTIPGKCQMLLTVKPFRTLFEKVRNLPGVSKKIKGLLTVKHFRKLSEKIRNLPGVSKKIKGMKKKKVPVFEYLDEFLF